MDPLKAFSVDFHATIAASLLRQALEVPEGNPFVNKSREVARYTENTFPIMVSSSQGLMQPVICTAKETFDEFLADLTRIMKMTAEPKTLGVRWESGHDYNFGIVTPESLHVVFRAMQTRRGKDCFQLGKGQTTGSTQSDSFLNC